jgi:hypothetical protein
VIIIRLCPGLLTNGVADIPDIPLDKVAAENLSQEERDKYMTLVADRQKKLASAFRKHMTEGQKYDTPNPYRVTFYTEVTNAAEVVNFLSFPVFVRMTFFSSLRESANESKTNKNFSMAGMFWKAKACQCKRQATNSVAS